MPLKSARDYFEFLASLGVTKHIGSMEATRKLIDLCHIKPGDAVLDVGCGVGATPAYLAKKVGCRAFGIDLLESMIVQAVDRVRPDGIQDRATFAVADARQLPFKDNVFDAVLTESVNTFFEDKQAAIREYMRVTKPGGYVGVTEGIWLKPVPPEIATYYKQTVYGDALESQAWLDILVGAGLKDVDGGGYQVNIPTESRGRFERYGCRGILKSIGRTLVTVFKN